MTFLEAALEILRHEGKPLHFKELTERALGKKLLTFVGRTPEVSAEERAAYAKTDTAASSANGASEGGERKDSRGRDGRDGGREGRDAGGGRDDSRRRGRRRRGRGRGGSDEGPAERRGPPLA